MIFVRNRKPSSLFVFIYNRLLLIILSMAVLCIGLSLTAFFYNDSYYSRIIYQKQVNRLSFISGNIEDKLLQIRSMQYSLINDQSICDLNTLYAYSMPAQQYSMLSQAQKMLVNLCNSNEYVQQAFLYVGGCGKLIDQTGIRDASPSQFQPILTASCNASDYLFWYDGGLYMVESTYQDYQNPDGDANHLAVFQVVKLDLGVIQEELKYAQLTQRDIVALVDSHNEIYAQTSSDSEWISKINQSNLTVNLSGTRYPGQYKVVRASMSVSDMKIYWLYEDTITANTWKKTTFFLVILGSSLLVMVAISFLLIYRSFYRPLSLLLEDAFSQVSKGNLKYRIRITHNYFFNSLYQCFNGMVERLDEMVEKDLKQQILLSRANFKHLQAQINPHFLYNSYYVLYRLIMVRDWESSQLLCQNISKFFQYITRDSEDEKTLAQEVEHARVYANIQGFRFRKMLRIQFAKPDSEYEDIMVPRLIIQPVLENAFKYVFDDVPADGKATLRVSFRQVDQRIIVCVENSGEITDRQLENIRQRIASAEEGGEITGLSNINCRLNIFFNQKRSLQVGRSDLGGLAVYIYMSIL